MKIVDVRVVSLGYMKDFPEVPRSFALVRIETDSGIVGYGEASSSYGHFYPFLVKTVVEDILARTLIDRSPLDIEPLLTRMHLYLDPWIGWGGITNQAIGGVEIALWDILGKAVGQPICRLLGGYRERIPLYASGISYFDVDPQWHAHFFDPSLSRGFKGVKIRVGHTQDRAWDTRLVEVVRKHIGDELKLMVDAYWSYSLPTAVRFSKVLADYDAYFFEEPIPQYQLEGLAKLRAESPVSIAVGERGYTLRDFKALIDYEAADVWQPDATVAGGILECSKIAALAKASDIPVFPHIGGLTAVGMAANLHLAAVVGPPMLEYDFSPYQPLRDELLSDPIFILDRIEDGCLQVPEGPGLGIEIDESAFDRFPYKPGKVYPDIFPQLGAGNL